MSTISIDVDLDYVLMSLNWYARAKTLKFFQERKYIPKSLEVTSSGFLELPQAKLYPEPVSEFDCAAEKLIGNGWRLTKEQEDYVINLAKQF